MGVTVESGIAQHAEDATPIEAAHDGEIVQTISIAAAADGGGSNAAAGDADDDVGLGSDALDVFFHSRLVQRPIAEVQAFLRTPSMERIATIAYVRSLWINCTFAIVLFAVSRAHTWPVMSR